MDSNPGVRLGGAEVIDEDVKMAEAVKIAKEADVVIAIVGLNADWETEGYDRKTLALPGRTDELIEKVLAVNPNTVVVTQSVSAPICGFMGTNELNALGTRVRRSRFHGRTQFPLSFIRGTWVMRRVMRLRMFSLARKTRRASYH
jgi:hypothetical protein